MIHEGYTPMEKECGLCSGDSLWSNSYEIVCLKCNITYRKDDIKNNTLEKENFYEDRPTDENGNIIPQGAFYSAYKEWNSNED